MSTKVNIVNDSSPKVISITEMKPLQVAVIHGDHHNCGHVVMRTASIDNFEVIDITDPKPDNCWENHASFLVRLVHAEITVKIKE